MSMYTARVNFTPAAGDCAIHVKGSATVRAGLCEFNISSDATPVEQSGEYQVARTTTGGTTPVNGTVTPVKAQSFSPAAACTLDTAGYTTEPTIGDIFGDYSVHQKNSYRWVAYPGREYFSAPAANAGVGIFVIGQSAAFSVNINASWIE